MKENYQLDSGPQGHSRASSKAENVEMGRSDDESDSSSSSFGEREGNSIGLSPIIP